MIRLSVRAFLLVVGATAAAVARGAELPEPLVALQRARAAIETGQVIWSTRCNLERKEDDIVWRWHSYDVPRYYTSTITAREYMVEDHGDPEGVVFRGPDGAPDPDMGYRPVRYLWYGDAQWEHRDQSILADVHQALRDVPDVRALGVATGLAYGQGVQDVLPSDGDDWQFKATMRNESCVLDASRPHSDTIARYVLDPKCGWNPVAVEVWSGNRLLHAVRTTLKQYGDVWFPEQVRLFDSTFKDCNEPMYVIDVLSARFNEPDLPTHLAPESIGIEVGTNLHLYTKGDQFHPLPDMYGWDGKQVAPLKDIFHRVDAGELKVGPMTKAQAERQLALNIGVEQTASVWERYVRRFIARYALNDDQSERALKVLHDCQERAEGHLGRSAEDIKMIRERVRELTDPTRPAAADSAATLSKLKEKMLRIQAPISEIFYGQLVPRLDSLPTRAQREAVAQRENQKKIPASRPAEGGGASRGP